MKYYERMRNLEDQIIRLDTIESMLRILGNAEPDREDVFNIVWYLQDEVKNINKNLSENFHKLWEEVRNDSYKKNTTEYIPPTQSSNELNDIVNSWVRPENC